MVMARGTSGVTCARRRVGRYPCRLAGADRERHAPVLTAAWTSRHHLTLGAEWAFGRARARLLRALNGLGTMFHAFGARVAVVAAASRARTVAVDRAELPAGAIAEALLAA